ncbi:MAG: MerR family transcriptional regulator [Gammaproteobacteria bacterium]|nr:MerR family transcriptional regulator [Gammaproteobacteria bacterium]MCP4089155.1 MerR family transcriptional regulator [Gammaproteobacteria bacterium]MCP4276821.1 MerR family transcriptional regulator [Gammaproteobacteria bacterium]MCP4830664.1 MerR family transcriptional regulator [Gammaproteobacteria bacterium]MCP4928473.1 MerR family transcriptional regulator [Gammaproteobacteria bacterium]
MIRSYTINELEELTAVNKRTISDYITKGLLSGPSHRGRGAVYSQRDFNILRVIPKLRSLLKDEYGSLKLISIFLAQLSVPDIQTLAARDTERSFTVEVRRLRVRLSLMGLMPHVSPEKFDQVLDHLSPEQICSIDTGRVQIGTVIDLSKLFSLERELSGGVSSEQLNRFTTDFEDTDILPRLSGDFFPEQGLEETIPVRSASSALKVNGQDDNANGPEVKKLLVLKLEEIANRLDRVEQMLDSEAGQ